MPATYGVLSAQDVYLHRLVGGVSKGAFGPINCSKLDLTQPDPDVVTRVSHMRTTRGQALDSASVPKPMEIEITFDDLAPDLIAMGLLGTPAPYAQAAATNVAATVRVYHDRWVALGKNSLTAFSISGKTEGEDYEVNLSGGLLRALSTGAIADDTDVSVTYSCAARAGSDIYAGTTSVIQLGIETRGGNLFVDGQSVDLDVWQANVSPSGALAWISSEPMSVSLKGTLITPAGKAGPYRYRVHAPA